MSSDLRRLPQWHTLLPLDTPFFSPAKQDIDRVSQALDLSWADSTKSTYTRNLQHFHSFCDSRNIPLEHRFPVPESILTIYTASHLGQYTASTVQQRLSALKHYHIINNLTWSGSDRISKMLRGIKIAAPSSSSRRSRPAISISMLLTLLKELDLATPIDAAIAACACTAFWGQCRLGELLPSTVSSTNTATLSLPSRAHLTCSASQSKKDSHFTLLLPRTKTAPLGQTVTLLPQNSRSNPLKLLKHHLAINRLPRHAPLFAYARNSSPLDETFAILTKDTFLRRCNQIWSLKGYDHFTGHSFRIGGTTTLLSLGVPPDVVKTMGRWSSDSFLRYWRHIDRIAIAQTPFRPRGRGTKATRKPRVSKFSPISK